MGWKKTFKKITKGTGDVFSGKAGFSLMDDFKNWYDGTDAARKQMQMQDEYNMKYWNLQNAYNHPAEQMKRYQEAGLNPNLIYGQSNTASPVGSVSPGNIETGAGVLNKAAQTVASFYNLKAMAAQVANMRQQNKNLQAQDTLLNSQAEFVNQQARSQELKNIYFQNTGRLPRSEGSLGASVGDFFRYMDWLVPSNKENGARVPSHINDKSMFKVWFNKMKNDMNNKFGVEKRRPKEGVYIKSKW